MLKFPGGFLWGTATAAYQIEGGHCADDKGPSIWDTSSQVPRKIFHKHNGDVACDHYHRYPDDVRTMAELGLNAYRFSVSWPRLMPGSAGIQISDKTRFTPHERRPHGSHLRRLPRHP
jgi:beta-glucosidase